MLTNTRAMTAGYRLRHWAEILQKQKESGLNIRSYCEGNGIKEHRYYYWQRRLREAANNELAKVESDTTGLVPARSNSPIVWAGIDMNTLDAQSSRPVTDSPESKNNIKICRDGWTVMVESGFDAGTLTEALRVVNRICF